jgi:hypothetical protein
MEALQIKWEELSQGLSRHSRVLQGSVIINALRSNTETKVIQKEEMIPAQHIYPNLPQSTQALWDQAVTDMKSTPLLSKVFVIDTGSQFEVDKEWEETVGFEDGVSAVLIPCTPHGLGKRSIKRNMLPSSFQYASGHQSADCEDAPLYASLLGRGTITRLGNSFPGGQDILVHLSGHCLHISIPYTARNQSYLHEYKLVPANDIGFLLEGLHSGKLGDCYLAPLTDPVAFAVHGSSLNMIMALENSVQLHLPLYPQIEASNESIRILTFIRDIPRHIWASHRAERTDFQDAIISLTHSSPGCFTKEEIWQLQDHMGIKYKWREEGDSEGDNDHMNM